MKQGIIRLELGATFSNLAREIPHDLLSLGFGVLNMRWRREGGGEWGIVCYKFTYIIFVIARILSFFSHLFSLFSLLKLHLSDIYT